MVVWAVLLSGLLAGSPPSPADVEAAYADRQYEAVLTLAREALETARPLSKAESARMHELMALSHAAFDQSQASIDAFVRVLKLDVRYDPGQRVSPKIRGLFEQARRQVPLPFTPSAAAAVESVPLTRRWWFWTGAATLVAAGTTAAILMTRSRLPEGNLPTGRLP